VTDDLILVPGTGQLLVLSTAADDELATLAIELAAAARQITAIRGQIDDELVGRLQASDQKERRTPAGYVIRYDQAGRREWNPDDLETVVRDLADRGIIQPARYTGLLRHETRVDGNIAKRLLAQVTGNALAQVQQCFRWVAQRPRVTILLPGQPAIDATSEDE
jgi:hypothetical protein